jgi:transposase InsO family protein
MAWKVDTLVDVRLSFVSECLNSGQSIAELCRAFEISRKTAYKWLNRYELGGVEALADKSRSRHTQAQQTPSEQVRLICELASDKEHWGAKKIKARLEKLHPSLVFPSATTVHNIIQSSLGLTRCHRTSKHLHLQENRPECSSPNDLWNMDFKGEFRLGSGILCYPLTVTDTLSRFLLEVRGLESTKIITAQQALHNLFEKHGLPKAIRSDNGVPFAAYNGFARLSQLSVWLIELGITPYFINPGRPGENGAHERMHRVLKKETTRPPGSCMYEQQKRFDEFRNEYNEERPHEALEMKAPSEVYRRSDITYKGPKAPRYPMHHEVKMLGKDGQLYWKGREIKVSGAMSKKEIGLEEIDDGIWAVHFHHLKLGYFDDKQGIVKQTLPLNPK